jgi:hypothetical protein
LYCQHNSVFNATKVIKLLVAGIDFAVFYLTQLFEQNTRKIGYVIFFVYIWSLDREKRVKEKHRKYKI